jgi:V8-like Glu-specific endopeptidase
MSWSGASAAELEAELEYEGTGLPETGVEYTISGPTDDRFPIPARATRPSSLLFPTSTICFIEMTAADGRQFTGSGTLIAPQVVLTAKHVLQDVSPPRCQRANSVGTPFSIIRVTPGADFSGTTAKGRRPAVPESQVATGARVRVDPNLDFGVVILSRPFTSPNRFMMLQPRGNANTATLLTIAGYPCDKPTGTMWGHSGRIPLRDVSPTHLFYTIDTCPGHSGSPIWLLGNDGIRLLLGVHTSGDPRGLPGSRCENDPLLRTCSPTGAATTPIGGAKNCGVRVTCDVINQIIGWCQEFGVRGPVVDQTQFNIRCKPAPGVRPFRVLDRFQFDHPTLRPFHAPILTAVARAVVASWSTRQPVRTVRLAGHTDSRGPSAYNVVLGQRRAEAVRNALVQTINRLRAGLSRRINFAVESFGETRPIAPSTTAAGRARNRRVEVFLLRV